MSSHLSAHASPALSSNRGGSSGSLIDELLPWADPYISQLARAQETRCAALRDSLHFVRTLAESPLERQPRCASK